MTRSRAAVLARLAAETVLQCARPLRPEAAAEAVRRRAAGRAEAFLAALDASVWPVESSPVRRLLAWARCGSGDLAAAVRRDGVERALADLHARGVRFSADELAGRAPVARPGLEIPPAPGAFENPLSARNAFVARTSGSTSEARRVPYGWPLFAEEAAEEGLLLRCHGLLDAPLALWYPAPPGIAGVHNLLLHWKLGRAPARWFSQVEPPRWRTAPDLALACSGLRVAGLPLRSPAPRHVPLDRAVEVARWLDEGRGRGERRVLKAFASSAVRMAHAARAAGLDLSGQVAFTGGEPLTADRRRILEGVGLAVHARYVATEAGLVAGGCGRLDGPDGMHLYTDRLAVLVDGRPPEAAPARGALAFTSLSATAPLVLLNAEPGDDAEVRRAGCGCTLGEAGLDVALREVSAPAKVTGEGITIPAAALAAAAAEAVAPFGGGPDDVQVAWSDDEGGRTRVTVSVSPRIAADDGAIRDAVLARVAAMRAGPLAARLWSEAGSLAVVRREPEPSDGRKVLPWRRPPAAPRA